VDIVLWIVNALSFAEVYRFCIHPSSKRETTHKPVVGTLPSPHVFRSVANSVMHRTVGKHSGRLHEVGLTFVCGSVYQTRLFRKRPFWQSNLDGTDVVSRVTTGTVSVPSLEFKIPCGVTENENSRLCVYSVQEMWSAQSSGFLFFIFTSSRV